MKYGILSDETLEFGNDDFTQSGIFMCFIDFQSFTLKGDVIYLEY